MTDRRIQEADGAAAQGSVPLWRGTARKADAWGSVLGASEYVVRAVRFGIVDPPSLPFKEGLVLEEIPQTAENREFATRDLASGLKEGVYERVSKEEVRELVLEGKMVSSAFLVWQGDVEDRKGRLVVNLHHQSQHWPRRRVKMKTIQGFATEMERGDMMMSWEIKSGYRHFSLHPSMRDYFIFRYGGVFYRCVALPFSWGRSVLWFMKLLRPLLQYIREKLHYRVLPYIDDFLLAPSPPGRAAGAEDCARARVKLEWLFGALGVVRHSTKGEWGGARQLDHLGVHVDSEKMRVFVSEKKVARVRRLAKKVMAVAQHNRRLVPLQLLRYFCGVCVSLSLALPLARFYTRSLYFDMSLAERRRDEREERGQSPQLWSRVSATDAEDFARSDELEESAWTSKRCAAKPSVGDGGRARALRARQFFGAFPDVSAPCGRPSIKPKKDAGLVRVCRQSLRYLAYWRALARGAGRNFVRLPSDVMIHSDAADVGYGGTMGHGEEDGSQGLWEVQGFWSATDREQSITLRELRAVRLLLHRHFYDYVSDPRVRKVLVQEDNQAVMYVLNAMVSASRPMMVELRMLEVLLRVMGIRIEARWILSAVKRFADALSRTWDPGDFRATDAVVRSIQEQHGLDTVAVGERPLGETLPARKKYLATQLEEDWGDGMARLYNPPVDMLPLVVRKLEAEGGREILVAPRWPAQPWFARLSALSSTMTELGPEAIPEGLWQGERHVNDEWGMVIAQIS